MAEMVPPGIFPVDDFHPGPMYSPMDPSGQPFHDPFGQHMNQPPPPPPPPMHRQPPVFATFNDDLGPRISNLNLDDEPRARSQKRGGSPVQRKSVGGKRRSSSPGKSLKSYRYCRFTKTGEDWSLADRFLMTSSRQAIDDKIKKNKKRYGDAQDQLTKMPSTRRGQIVRMIEELNEEEKDTNAEWYPVMIEPMMREVKGTRSVRIMDVIFTRTEQFGSSFHTKDRSRSESYMGTRVDLREPVKSKDKARKDGKERDGGAGGKDKDKDKDKSKAKDTDPFGSSKLFTPDGKPLDEHGHVPFENGGLPPHLPREEPIGKRLPPPLNRSQSRDKNIERGSFGEIASGIHAVPEDMSLDGDLAQFGQDFRSRRRDSGIEIQPIDPTDPRGRRQSTRRNARSRSRSRVRSKSRPPGILIPPNEPRRGDRANQDFHGERGDSSISSQEDYIFGEVDEVSSHTSGSLHNEFLDRGHLSQTRRQSSTKYDQAPSREHYRGPTNPSGPTRYPAGERIVIPERRSTISGRPRPFNYAPTQQVPLTRAITYIADDRSLEQMPLSPTRGNLRSSSPGLRQVDLFYPAEMAPREENREMERYVDGYMSAQVRREQQDLMAREWRVEMRERALQEKERERRRDKGYIVGSGGYAGGPYGGGYNGGYSGGYDRGYDQGYGGRGSDYYRGSGGQYYGR